MGHAEILSLVCRFAAALVNQPLWVMNIVPANGPDTLGIIFDRGLIGVYHDWCESLNTYPRTYDLLHSAFLFENLKKRYHKTPSIDEHLQQLRPHLMPFYLQVWYPRCCCRNGSYIETWWMGLDSGYCSDDQKDASHTALSSLEHHSPQKADSCWQKKFLAPKWNIYLITLRSLIISNLSVRFVFSAASCKGKCSPS